MKPIIFLNKTRIPEKWYIRLVIKNPDDKLAKRLVKCNYLELESRSGLYMVSYSDHNVRLLTDQFSDVATINTKYLTHLAGARLVSLVFSSDVSMSFR